MSSTFRCRLLLFLLLAGASANALRAGPDQPPAAGPGKVFGPLNVAATRILAGDGHPMGNDAPVKALASWTLNFWFRSDEPLADYTLLAGFGDGGAARGGQRYLANFPEGLHFWGGFVDVDTKTKLAAGRWQMVSAAYDGTTLTLYLDGLPVGSQAISLADAAPVARLAPGAPWPHGHRFRGKIALFTVGDRALSADEIHALLADAGRLDASTFEHPRQTWPEQGPTYLLKDLQQDRASLPVSAAPPSAPVAKPFQPADSPLTALGDGDWKLVGRWKMVEAPRVPATSEAISRAGFPIRDWYDAEVPGTVLTTLVNRGVYPDPYYGLNNLAIPETLNKQDYWYRTEFAPPPETLGRDLSLNFNGINYVAEVWLNGTRLGEIRGAFTRGSFNVSKLLQPGQPNALAVRVSPPAHPGVPHEQSLKAGAGPNGGAMCVDGPTFICAEGWDWIPGIRDRCTGIWQDVVLHADGGVRIADPQVVTTLPLPDVSRADVVVSAELKNAGGAEARGVLKGTFEGVAFEQSITLAAGESRKIAFAPAQFPQLTVTHPRLWWPNGYGSPELYHLGLTFVTADGAISDVKRTRFGIREVSYELTALDAADKDRRFEYRPALAGGKPVIDHRHAAMINTELGWLPSLMPQAEQSAALKPSDDAATAPFLVIKVNGQKIVCKGGNWGMEDALKNISREHLEPYVRLERDAHMTMIRNWCGQSTEEALFDLCDEYGLLVWDEFWLTTQPSNLEPFDAPLFLANARDTITRFRNHPSIVIWSGRNEGVPPPAINEGLDALVRTCDGTRFYQPSSIRINLLPSGPWIYADPVREFKVGCGFTTELGLPCPPTVDAMRAMMPPADQWPISDAWAYHDWHQTGGGNVAPFMETMTKQFGAPIDLEDFSRKAQMLNYEGYRAIFEGLNAMLWKPASGRLIWMTHPSLPSMNWQLYSSDYEPNGAFFGAQKGCEPIHVQMNLPDGKIVLTNNTLNPLPDVNVTARVVSAAGEPIWKQETRVSPPANASVEVFDAQWPTPPATALRFLKLTATNADGTVLSDNVYWHTAKEPNAQTLDALPPVRLDLTARVAAGRDAPEIVVTLGNSTGNIALQAALTLRDAGSGERILPVFYSENYVSLLPGEKREVRIQVGPGTATDHLKVSIRGWNVEAGETGCSSQ